jgi:hypothetical protein
MKWHRAIRVASLLVFAAGIGLLIHRVSRSPEQQDLTRYVEVEVPSMLAAEQPIQERIDRLGQAPGLKPEEARKLLVDDVIPRLLKLKKGVEQIQTRTDETRWLNDEYLKVTDQLVDACRKCVQVIDDPKLPQVEGLKQVRERFAEVRKAYAAWDEHVQQACVRHRLAKPKAH